MPNTIHNMVGKTLYDTKHQKVGTIDNVYVTRQDEQPVFAAVLEGLIDARLVFVPVKLTYFDGNSVIANTTKEFINEAPSIRAGHNLNQQETQALYRYYHTTYELPNANQPQSGTKLTRQENEHASGDSADTKVSDTPVPESLPPSTTLPELGKSSMPNAPADRSPSTNDQELTVYPVDNPDSKTAAQSQAHPQTDTLSQQ